MQGPFFRLFRSNFGGRQIRFTQSEIGALTRLACRLIHSLPLAQSRMAARFFFTDFALRLVDHRYRRTRHDRRRCRCRFHFRFYGLNRFGLGFWFWHRYDDRGRLDRRRRWRRNGLNHGWRRFDFWRNWLRQRRFGLRVALHQHAFFAHFHLNRARLARRVGLLDFAR